MFRKKSQLVSLTKRDVAASLRESPNEPPCMHFPYPCALKKGNRIFNREKVLPYKRKVLPYKHVTERTHGGLFFWEQKFTYKK